MNDYKLDLLHFLAQDGDDEALLELADYYYFKCDKQMLSPKIRQLLLEAYQKLADKGQAHAMATLGGIYYEGLLLPQDFKAARAWFEKAADLNNPLAIIYLGYCHYYGRDIPVNHQIAYAYFAKAARMGHHNGMYKLGDMYYNGHYVEKDPAAAFFWFNEAIRIITTDSPEYPNIAYRIGHCFLLGDGVNKDLLQALTWLHQAESGCYQLIKTGDAYAGLTLVRVQEDLDTLRQALDADKTHRHADLGYHNPLHLS